MKGLLSFVFFMSVVVLTSGQSSYKYVMIPTKIPEIGEGIDPYGVSSTIQRVLTEKSVKCIFERNEKPADVCEALKVRLERESSLLKNKLKVELTDCLGRVVWSKTGEGRSKDFREGYAEAIQDAFLDFDELPAIKYSMPVVAESSSVAMPVQQTAQEPIAEKDVVQAADTDASQRVYFNSEYLFECKQGADGQLILIILNGTAVGYQKLQEVAVLKASDLPGIYSVRFTMPDGSVWAGVAHKTDSELKLSISSGEAKKVINLQKQ